MKNITVEEFINYLKENARMTDKLELTGDEFWGGRLYILREGTKDDLVDNLDEEFFNRE